MEWDRPHLDAGVRHHVWGQVATAPPSISYDPDPVRQSLDTLIDLLTRDDFHTGLITGLVALGVLVALVKFGAARFAAWGVILTSAGVVGIHLHIGRRFSLILALLAVGVGGWLLDRAASHRDRRMLQALAWVSVVFGGIIFSTRSGLPDILWVRLAAPLVLIVAAVALREWGEAERREYLGPMFLISAFGIWTAVPATESARILLGAALPMALTTLRPIGARIYGPGAFALTGLAVWLVARGGEPRPASIIGGWACLGILVALPLLLRLRPRVDIEVWKVVVAHAVTVLLAARIIGLQESTGVALAGMTILVVVLVMIGLSLKPRIQDARTT
ncbi:MAG: hypothetical protein ACFCU2_04175 [Acidimicrobiia bacterium]